MSTWFIDFMSRNFGWQIQLDSEAAIFRRPICEKVVWGIPVVGLTYLYFCRFLPVFIHRLDQPDIRSLMLQTTVVYIFFMLLFGTGIGPKDMRFDFRSKCYEYHYGFPIFYFTRRGNFSEIAHLAVWNRKFVGLTVEWKDRKRFQTTFLSCSSKSKARVLGERLGSSLGVAVKDGVILNFNR